MAYLAPGAEPPKRGKGSKLSAKMLRFVDEYMVDLVAAKAVLRAGYKTKNPPMMAQKLLHHPLVKAEIDKRTDAKRERNELTADYVLQKLVKIVEDTESGNPQAALRGLELLGKHLGMYKDRQEISGPDGGAIEMEQRTKEDVADFTSKLSRLIERERADGVSQFPKPRGAGTA